MNGRAGVNDRELRSGTIGVWCSIGVPILLVLLLVLFRFLSWFAESPVRIKWAAMGFIMTVPSVLVALMYSRR